MDILKFGSATIDSSQKIKQVLELIVNQRGNIIVLSSIKGFAEYLEDISQYFYNKNTEGAFEILNKFIDHLFVLRDELYESSESKSKSTDLILALKEYVKAFDGELFTLFEKRTLMAQGELLTSSLFAIALEEREFKVHIISALDYIRMDRNHNPDLPYIRNVLESLLNEISKDVIYLTQGYICTNSYGEIDDLRKGGSDSTAAILGAASNAKEIQIWGNDHVIYNIDKKLFPNAFVIPHLSFDEAAELAYFGSKVLHPTSIFPAKLAGVPVRLKSISAPSNQGTLIANNTVSNQVKAVGTRDNITLIQIKSSRMLLAHGFLHKIFEIFNRFETPIDMLASSEIGISLTIDNCEKLDLVEEELRRLGTINIKKEMVMVSIVGDEIMHTPSISETILNTMKKIPIQMISYGGSDLNISFLINANDKLKVLELLSTNLFK